MIKKIAVIGTGVIGTGWIIRFLAHDKKVIAYDKNLNSDKKYNTLKDQMASLLGYGVIIKLIISSDKFC